MSATHGIVGSSQQPLHYRQERRAEWNNVHRCLTVEHILPDIHPRTCSEIDRIKEVYHALIALDWLDRGDAANLSLTMARLRPSFLLGAGGNAGFSGASPEIRAMRIWQISRWTGLVIAERTKQWALYTHPENSDLTSFVSNDGRGDLTLGRALGYPYADCLSCTRGVHGAPVEKKYIIDVLVSAPGDRPWLRFADDVIDVQVGSQMICGFGRRESDIETTKAIARLWQEFLHEIDPDLEVRTEVANDPWPPREGLLTGDCSCRL